MSIPAFFLEGTALDKKTRLLIFLAAGVVVVISCLLIFAALISYHRVENMSRQVKEQIQTAETMREDSLLPGLDPSQSLAVP